MQHGIALLVKGHFQLVDWFNGRGVAIRFFFFHLFCSVYQEKIKGLEWNDANCNASLTYYRCTTVRLARSHLNSASHLTYTKNLKLGLRDLNVRVDSNEGVMRDSSTRFLFLFGPTYKPERKWTLVFRYFPAFLFQVVGNVGQRISGTSRSCFSQMSLWVKSIYRHITLWRVPSILQTCSKRVSA